VLTALVLQILKNEADFADTGDRSKFAARKASRRAISVSTP